MRSLLQEIYDTQIIEIERRKIDSQAGISARIWQMEMTLANDTYHVIQRARFYWTKYWTNQH